MGLGIRKFFHFLKCFLSRHRLKPVKGLLWLFSRAKNDLRNPLFISAVFAFWLIFLFCLSSLGPKKNESLIAASQFQGGPFVSQNAISYSESPDLYLIQGVGLKAVSNSAMLNPQVLGTLLGSTVESESNKEIIEYIVETGDTLWLIADKFNISLETVLWANNLNKNSPIQPGKKLIILPVSGLLHHIQKGDTIGTLAQRYKAKEEEIIGFNDLSFDGDIFIGDILLVPNGQMPVVKPKITPQLVPLASSYFICPISLPCRLTQGLHWYNAVDFSHGQCGEPIFATAAGTVLKVEITQSTSPSALAGAGNHLTILHPNGVVTVYGHLAKILVGPGQEVSQGQVIALLGGEPGTAGVGRSTGCHLHFGVSGAENPFAR